MKKNEDKKEINSNEAKIEEKNEKGSNKTGIFVLLGVVVFFVFIGLFFMSTYNSLVSLEEGVNQRWANVQSAYQRRADLIPNLVATVKKYSNYEGEVLTEITRARASIGSAKTPQELANADQELNSALSRLLVIVENYPDLKANQNYLDLQAQLEGTENRIKVERDLYNNAVKEFNQKIRFFPSNIIANIYGFKQKEYFEAQKGSENAPDVGKLFE
ncbi:MAG: LemA family protein [Candidatus Woesearchaeota archaeon]